jgi:drug/metabolite transporter (DMT)-like permease
MSLQGAKPLGLASPQRGLAILAMIGSAAAWGGATVMTKGALAVLPPFMLLLLQLSASCLALWLAVLLFGGVSLTPRRALSTAMPGLLEPGLAYGVAVPGLLLTSATSATVIGAAEPAFIGLLAWLLLGQRPRVGELLALLATFVGVLLIALEGDGGERQLTGDLLIVIGTLFAALYVILSRKAASAFPAHLVAALQQTAGLLVALILWLGALAFTAESVPGALPAGVVAFAMLSGVVQYAVAFWLYLVGLRHIPISTAGMFLALIPVFGLAGAVFVLGEQPSLAKLAGCGLVVLALLAVARR